MQLPISADESEIQQQATSVVEAYIRSMPYDAQDPLDTSMATHYALMTLASKVNSRLTKANDAVKDAVKAGKLALVTASKNYQRVCTVGTPRTTFNKDKFIDLVAVAFPDVPKFKLRELAEKEEAYNISAAPVTINFEYKGDM